MDSGNFIMSPTAALSPLAAADLNLFQNAGKSDPANAFGNDNKIKSPASQVAIIPRIDTNELNFDAFTLPLIRCSPFSRLTFRLRFRCQPLRFFSIQLSRHKFERADQFFY